MSSDVEMSSDVMSTMDPSARPPYITVLIEFNKYLIIVLLAFIMLAMGCVVTVDDFRVVLRRPFGAVIGLGCQFFILPLTAFTLANLLRLEAPFALGLLITASSPGGTISSLQTYWSHGNVCLSIVMTTVSTVAALGMLPFNLWLYSRSWTESTQTSIPYTNIIIGLVLIIIPVGVGMVIRWKSAKVARVISLIGSISGLAMIGVNLIINSIINPGIFSSSWTLWLAAALLPCCGYTFGYLFALLCCQKWKDRRTISFETGTQNVGIALSLTSVSFSGSPLFLDLLTFPTIFGFTLIFISFSLVGFFVLYDKYRPELPDPEDDKSQEEIRIEEANEGRGEEGVFKPALAEGHMHIVTASICHKEN